jgi:DNA-binding GntR family transcriptional regulator
MATEVLREEILNGRLRPGELLTEPMLCERVGVSRTPIREAVAELEAEGLIVRRNHRLMITELSAQAASEIYGARIPLEVEAARLVAAHGSSECLAELERAVAIAQFEASRDNWRGVAKSAREFHDTIFAHAGNSVLERMLHQLHDRVDHYRIFATPGGDSRLTASLAEHERLVSAISAQNQDEAVALMTKHLESARDHLLSSFAGRVAALGPGPGERQQS